ncbi:MAG: 5'-nucleotidase C-terminal domain-containing protein [Nonlabens sp.]|uniref:5'-nucleotidase C-terminal domain-containing protein n=1 Tax=Nonlabens sp. TaxID=1888209 RepID=UPI003EF61C10
MKTSIFRQVGKAFCYLAFAKALLITTSCKSSTLQLEKITAGQTVVDSTIQGVTEIEDYIAPYKESVDQQMDEKLSYNPVSMHKNDFKYNTPIGNMMAAIVRTQGAPVYKSRTGKEIDIVLLNHGGIRSDMPAGAVTMRRAYEIMPFDNEITVAELTGEQMNQLISYLVEKKRAHPIDGMKILLDKDGSLKSVSIQNQPLDMNKTYTVATNDYLYNGGDNMSFFKDTPQTKTDYKIRNAMIDFFKKVDTLKFERDDRFDIIN